jgi:DNA mismatch repair protein MutS
VRNYNIAVKEWKGDIIFLRRMVPGPADRSYGIEVARLAGVPKPVIQRAREILSRLEEKSEQLRRGDDRASRQRKTLLPGLFDTGPSEPEPQPKPHPLLEELRRTDPNELTPLQALNLLASWKRQWENGSDEKN